MFDGFGALSIESDHLNISYRNPDGWPLMTPKGAITAHIFNIGDEAAGPVVQLGRITEKVDETLDWRRIDPLHHHGSDQFRVLLWGHWLLGGRRMKAGGYGYQEAGIVYREHPHGSGDVAMLLLMGDRRGNGVTYAKDAELSIEFSDEWGGTRSPDEPYPHPAGDRGIAAVATTLGELNDGFALTDMASGGSTGLLGDPERGPVVHVVTAQPNCMALPACRSDTELLVIIVSGSCSIAGHTYGGSEVRVQRAGMPMNAVVAGPEGLDMILVVADRRALPRFEPENGYPALQENCERLTARLDPRPGGPPRRQAVDA